MTHPIREMLHKALLTVDTDDDCCTSICVQVAHELMWLSVDIGTNALKEMFLTWEHFSGDTGYPVPHEGKTPEDAYYGTEYMWVGEYGDKRKELLAYLIEQTGGQK